jgi:hypothetical protein
MIKKQKEQEKKTIVICMRHCNHKQNIVEIKGVAICIFCLEELLDKNHLNHITDLTDEELKMLKIKKNKMRK